GFEQDRGRERKVLSRGGRIETERFQGEIDLLACESNLSRREIPTGRTLVKQNRFNTCFVLSISPECPSEALREGGQGGLRHAVGMTSSCRRRTNKLKPASLAGFSLL
ncbi:MAG: hypothetical protein AAB461_03195, partial [Patescibacteria group bacterium]